MSFRQTAGARLLGLVRASSSATEGLTSFSELGTGVYFPFFCRLGIVEGSMSRSRAFISIPEGTLTLGGTGVDGKFGNAGSAAEAKTAKLKIKKKKGNTLNIKVLLDKIENTYRFDLFKGKR